MSEKTYTYQRSGDQPWSIVELSHPKPPTILAQTDNENHARKIVDALKLTTTHAHLRRALEEVKEELERGHDSQMAARENYSGHFTNAARIARSALALPPMEGRE